MLPREHHPDEIPTWVRTTARETAKSCLEREREQIARDATMKLLLYLREQHQNAILIIDAIITGRLERGTSQ